MTERVDERGGDMGAAARWLVCAGPGAVLGIVAALVASGFEGSVEWEPSLARACTKVAQAGDAGVIVGSLPGEDALVAACRFAQIACGRVVLCVEGARDVAVEAAMHGVAAAVEPPALARLLMGMAAPAVMDGLEEPGAGCGAGCMAPAAVSRAVPATLPEVSEDAAGCGMSPDASGGMRPAGRLPRTGVVEQLEEDARAREAAPAADTPASSAGPLGRAGGAVEVEPLVLRPVIDLPQLECRVAGEDEHVPTVCFMSARGGVGKTSLAVLAALSLARDGLRVALIDLDYQFGTCLGYLGASETYGLLDEGAQPGSLRVDARMLARCRSVPEPGLTAYEFCRMPEHAELLAGAGAQIVRAARAGADIALVDLPPGVGEDTAQVLDVADRCVLVTDRRAFALESLAVQQGLLVRMGVARTKLVALLNRCDARHRDEGFLSRAQFEVQIPQTVRVVDGGDEVSQMLAIGSAGELLNMRNRFALSAADMARALGADLGCRPVPVDVAAPAAVAAAPMARGAATVQAPREGLFGRKRREKRGEQVPCPF